MVRLAIRVESLTIHGKSGAYQYPRVLLRQGHCRTSSALLVPVHRQKKINVNIGSALVSVRLPQCVCVRIDIYDERIQL